MDKETIRRLVLEELGDADVRTDQCDIVRVGWRGRLAGIRVSEESGFEVRVFLRMRADHADFLTGPSIVSIVHCEEEAANELVFWLRRVNETNIDSYGADE